MKFQARLISLAVLFAWAPSWFRAAALSGNVTGTCVLQISVDGALGVGRSGTMLSSTAPGGRSSVIAVSAAGTAPEVHFSAPQLTGPSTSTPDAVSLIGYTSAEGANLQPISGTSTYKMFDLNDILTVKAVATNGKGFEPGKYAITTTVTCQQ